MSDSKSAPVMVDKIWPAKEGKNQDYSTLQVRQSRPRPKTSGNLLNAFLSDDGNSDISLVAFQTIKNSAIEALGLEEGSNLSQAMGEKLTLTVTEVTADQLASRSDKQSFQLKRNNAEDQMILVDEDGQPVFRKVSIQYIGTPEAEDRTVSHAGMVDSDTFSMEEFTTEDAKELAS